MTDLVLPSRRGFIAGLASLVAAPAIMRISSLMPVKALIDPYAGVSMHTLTEYVPSSDELAQFGVLYGVMFTRVEWPMNNAINWKDVFI